MSVAVERPAVENMDTAEEVQAGPFPIEALQVTHIFLHFYSLCSAVSSSFKVVRHWRLSQVQEVNVGHPIETLYSSQEMGIAAADIKKLKEGGEVAYVLSVSSFWHEYPSLTSELDNHPCRYQHSRGARIHEQTGTV